MKREIDFINLNLKTKSTNRSNNLWFYEDMKVHCYI